MTLRKSDYHPITIADKIIFERTLRHYPQIHSECSFITMFCWQNYAHYACTIIDERLLVSCTINGETTFRAPIGDTAPDIFEEVLELAKKEGGKIAMNFYNEADVRYMKNAHPKIPIYNMRGFSEYYYCAGELAELHGKKYQNIRGQINRFKAKYAYTIEKITEENIPEAQKMIDEWSISKHCEENRIMKEEVNAVHLSLKYWQNLGCEGLTIRIQPEGKIAAITIWEELNASTALIHFEKGFVRYNGIYKIINQETAKVLQKRYTWINRESDMDVPGLREAKLRYHPKHCAKAWYIKKNEIIL
ncbi:MAG TPA: phosphatidylglycerol lysyltransferase domain-containing protein [Methanocorpusculum sp.]|nr:phosphatidylglycerol lysyltransferase domain-containing protein [Methanocorpusculum sp.]